MSENRDIRFRFSLGNEITITEAVVGIFGITEGNPEMFEGRIVDEQDFLVHLPVDEAQHFYIVAEIRAVLLDGRKVRTGDRTVQLLAQSKEAPGVTITTDLAEALPEVRGDPQRLTQVFLNLGLNALQAMSGRGALKISTHLTTRYEPGLGAMLARDVVPLLVLCERVLVGCDVQTTALAECKFSLARLLGKRAPDAV